MEDLTLLGQVIPKNNNGNLEELPIQFKVYKMNTDGSWSDEPVQEKIVKTDEEGLAEYKANLEPGYYQVQLDLLENIFYSVSHSKSEIVVYKPDDGQLLKANGHIDVGDVFGENANKLHLQSSLEYNESGKVEGDLRVNVTPKGLRLDVSVEWLAIGVNNTYIQGTAKDGGETYTVRIILNKDNGQAASIIIWEEVDTNSKPLHELFDQPFKGDIKF